MNRKKVLEIISLLASLILALFSCFPQIRSYTLGEEAAMGKSVAFFKVPTKSELRARVSLGTESAPQQVVITLPPPNEVRNGVVMQMAIWPENAQEGDSPWASARIGSREEGTSLISSNPRLMKALANTGSVSVVVAYFGYKPTTVDSGQTDLIASLIQGGPHFMWADVSGAGVAKLPTLATVVLPPRVQMIYVAAAETLLVQVGSGAALVGLGCKQSLTVDGLPQTDPDTEEMIYKAQGKPPYTFGVPVRSHPRLQAGGVFHISCIVKDTLGNRVEFFPYFIVGRSRDFVFLEKETRVPAFPSYFFPGDPMPQEPKLIEGWGRDVK